MILNIRNKYFINIILPIVLLITLNSTTHARDFSYYQNQLQTPDGLNLKKGYYDTYITHMYDSFINNTHQAIEVNFAYKLRTITKQLYDLVVNKTFLELNLASKTQWNTNSLQILRDCVNDKADYFTIEKQCVPHDLWAEGYQIYAECASDIVKSTIESCLPA